jgi:hypothetical protein
MPFIIKDLRLAWIWLESFSASLTDPPQDLVARCSLSKQEDYQGVFSEARAQPAPGPFVVPWDMTKPERKQYFWTYYFENVSPHQVQPKEAWRKLVPLRRRAEVSVKAAWLPGRVRFHDYHYPHALALVASAVLQGDLTLDKAVDMACQVGRGGEFDSTFADGQTGRYSLPVLATHTLDLARSTSFGLDAPAGPQSQPFTVATVVRAVGDLDREAANPENGDVHRALDGLCRGYHDWRVTPPEPFKDSVLTTRRAPLSHLLYGLKRGRAVWYPASFLPSALQRHSLGCYHQNLLFASLQTDSLLKLLAMAHEIGENRLSRSMGKLVKSAAGIVGRLYGGNDKCYRSQSPRRQIDDSGLVGVVNQVRAYYDAMPPLKAGKQP